MKPNLRTRVAGFVVCFALTTGISSSNAQMPGNSPLPPTDINTSENGNLVPPIVSAASNEEPTHILAPIIQGTQPTGNAALPPIVSGNVLTPKFADEVSEVAQDIQQTSGTQIHEGYAVQSAGDVINGTPVGMPVPQQFAPRQALPPITQNTNPVFGNPLGTPMSAPPSFVQASSPLSVESTFMTQDEGSKLLPMEVPPSNTVPHSVVTGDILQPAMSVPAGPCHGCASGCNSCGNLVSPSTSIGRSFLRPTGTIASSIVGCNSCGNAGCSSCIGNSTSACSSCGQNGCYDHNSVDQRFAACGFISRARSYFIMDVLYMTRANGEVQGINLSPIGEFDYGFGTRFTVGRRSDAANGREFTYYGTFDIEDGGTVTDPLARIRRRFIPDGTFITDVDLSAFSNVDSATERLQTGFQSFEYNRVRWGWDVVKVMFGARYVYLEDDYDLTTSNIFAETGSLTVDAKNHMVGPQVGLEMFYDVGFRWSVSGAGKFGLMLNAYDADVASSSSGFGLTNSGTNDADMAFLVDFGLTAHYQLTSRSRFRLGYNLLFLGDVTTASEAFPTVLSPFSSNSLDADDDALFSGLSLGLEFYR